MGKENDAMLSYLEDNERFADLFNLVYFGGRQVVRAQELLEASEVYPARPKEDERPRIRDIKRRLGSGKELKILAVEAQSETNYYMPWRLMEYDCREYGRQIRERQRKNRDEEKDKARSAHVSGDEQKNVYQNAGESLGEFKKSDRIAPVYTICLYHGTEEWDEPKSLKDMMDFGEATPEEQRVQPVC